MNFVVKSIGENAELNAQNDVIPLAAGDTYLKLSAGKTIPNNITVGNVPVSTVLNDNHGVLFGNGYTLLTYASPFYYMFPYCLGSESRVKMTICRIGTSTATQALLYCGSTATTDQFSIKQVGSTFTLRDTYGTSSIDSISIPFEEALEIDKNKNVTTIRNCKTGTVTVITHPVQVFRSDKVVTFGVSYTGNRTAPTFADQCTTSQMAFGMQIYDYDKLLFKTALDSKSTRFGIYLTDWHMLNLVNTTYKDASGNTQTISPTVYKIRNRNTATETNNHGVGKTLDVPLSPVGSLDLRNYTMMESLGFDVKDGSKYGYLDTGLVPNDFDGLYTYEIKVKDYSSVRGHSYVGVNDDLSSSTTGRIRPGNLYKETTTGINLWLGSSWVEQVSDIVGKIKTYKLQIHSTNGTSIVYSFWTDGECVADHKTAQGSNLSNFPLYLFSININNSSSITSSYCANIDVYHFKFWDKNGKLVFDGVPATGPCEDVDIGEPYYHGGLFNKINGTFKPLIQKSENATGGSN